MFFEKVRQHKINKLPFVIYAKPQSETIVGLFQNDDILYELSDENGFCFVSFDKTQKILIPENKSTLVFQKITRNNHYITPKIETSYVEQDKISFENTVKKALYAIENNQFEKVVLSRKEEIVIENLDIVLLFQKMISIYENAFNYCFYHPKIGLFFGATPEQLVKIEKDSLQTVALAGTQIFAENLTWQPKEINEQQIVTNYIIDTLKPFSKTTTVSKPYTSKAGNLAHIKTDIETKIDTTKVYEIINCLHPTPAVCGFPKQEAQQFIVKNENYSRDFYTGFLGEWKKNFQSFALDEYDLYVNLRSMKIDKNKATLYIGCGINKDSNPEKEFFETVNKSVTMKQILI